MKEYKVVYDYKGNQIEAGQNGWIPDKEIAEKILDKKQKQHLFHDNTLYLLERESKNSPITYRVYNGKRVYNESLMYYDALVVGDYVEETVINNAINCLPPVCNNRSCMQMGGAYSTRIDKDGKWKTTFLTFCEVASGIWKFCGDCFRGESEQTGKKPAII